MKFVAFIGLLLLTWVRWTPAEAKRPGDPDEDLLPCVASVGGPVRALEVRGNTAYVGVGRHLMIFDVSPSCRPTLRGKAGPLGNSVKQVAVLADYALVREDVTDKLYVFDVADMERPREIPAPFSPGGEKSGAATAPQVFSLIVDGSRVWVGCRGAMLLVGADGSRGLHEISRYDWPVNGNLVMADRGNLYFAEGGELEIWRASDGSFQKLGTLSFPGPVTAVAAGDRYAYVAAGPAGLRIVDVSADPGEVGACGIDGFASDVCIGEGGVFVADAMSGLHVIDISRSEQPKCVGTVPTRGVALGVRAHGSRALVADDEGGLCIIDCSELEAPTRYEVPLWPRWASGVSVDGNIAYVADAYGALLSFGVDNPQRPRLLGLCETSGPALWVDQYGGRAYVACGEAGVLLVERTEEGRPRIVGRCDTRGCANYVKVRFPYAYVADGAEGVSVIDVRESTRPSLAGRCNVGGWTWAVEPVGARVVVASCWGGLKVVDASDPEKPRELWAGRKGWPSVDWIQAIASFGDQIYVSDFPDVDVLRLLDSGELVRKRVLQGGHSAVPLFPAKGRSISVSRNLLVVGCKYGAVVWNLAGRAGAEIAGVCWAGGDVRAISIAGGHAFMACGRDGVIVARLPRQEEGQGGD